ncbi:MAG TPA: Ig-like domain-containing protein, partial [Candidatus Limnocylindrales bacterium]
MRIGLVDLGVDWGSAQPSSHHRLSPVRVLPAPEGNAVNTDRRLASSYAPRAFVKQRTWVVIVVVALAAASMLAISAAQAQRVIAYEDADPAVTSITASSDTSSVDASAEGEEHVVITVTAKDSAGDIRTDDIDTVTLTTDVGKLVTAGNTVGAPTVDAESAGSGLYTAELIVTVPELATITGTINGADITTAPAAVQFSVGALDRFAVSTEPAETDYVAGEAFEVTARAQDQWENPLLDYAGGASLGGLSEAPDDTPAAYTQPSSWTGGVGIGQATAYLAGENQIVTIADGDASGSSGLLTVFPATLDHFSLSAVAGVIAGTPIPDVTVTALDAYDNIV